MTLGLWKDRYEAGEKLAEGLIRYRGERGVVYALPRGGVVLGSIVAARLNMPLDLVITRKIGHPRDPEYAVCAVGEGGELVCNPHVRESLEDMWLEEMNEKALQEIERRRRRYVRGRQRQSSYERIAILVDDGVATGLTMQAAIREIRRDRPLKIIVAVPIAQRATVVRLEQLADEVITLRTDEHFLGSVGAYYRDFEQVSDEEVVTLLGRTGT